MYVQLDYYNRINQGGGKGRGRRRRRSRRRRRRRGRRRKFPTCVKVKVIDSFEAAALLPHLITIITYLSKARVPLTI